jgi:hypothetical protein
MTISARSATVTRRSERLQPNSNGNSFLDQFARKLSNFEQTTAVHVRCFDHHRGIALSGPNPTPPATIGLGGVVHFAWGLEAACPSAERLDGRSGRNIAFHFLRAADAVFLRAFQKIAPDGGRLRNDQQLTSMSELTLPAWWNRHEWLGTDVSAKCADQ